MNPIPRHIAIIMDGNGRWAARNALPRLEGHRKGIEVVEDITIVCRKMGVSYLTLYAFSDENWERPPDEVNALMGMLVEFLKIKRPKFMENQIRFVSFGDRDRLPAKVISALEEMETATRDLNGMTLNVALSYGSRNEICRAFKRAVDSGIKDITSSVISDHLDTAGMIDPDLLIRTSGEVRISNFLLWQIAYTELYFTDTMWPDFTKQDLQKAIDDFRKRERRFGKTSEQL